MIGLSHLDNFYTDEFKRQRKRRIIVYTVTRSLVTVRATSCQRMGLNSIESTNSMNEAVSFF